MPIFYGAGTYGLIIKRLFNEKWIAYIDSFHYGKNYEGLNTISLSKADNDKRVYISTKFHHRDVLEALLKHGFAEEQIVNVGKMLEDLAMRQYFDLEAMNFSEDEVFIDVGGYDGGTIQIFKELCHDKFSKIISFEPDIDNYNLISKKAERDNRIKIISKGAWDKEGKISFSSSEGEKSAISDSGSVSILKMDIEGAEYEALVGAEEIIRTKKPKLAICVYHKPEDIFTIPQLVLEYNPEYTLYFRSYTFREMDTVMYAIP